jgi:hypothetical protein
VDVTGSGSCSVAGFGISGVEPPGIRCHSVSNLPIILHRVSKCVCTYSNRVLTPRAAFI